MEACTVTLYPPPLPSLPNTIVCANTIVRDSRSNGNWADVLAKPKPFTFDASILIFRLPACSRRSKISASRHNNPSPPIQRNDREREREREREGGREREGVKRDWT